MIKLDDKFSITEFLDIFKGSSLKGNEIIEFEYRGENFSLSISELLDQPAGHKIFDNMENIRYIQKIDKIIDSL